MNPDCRIYSVPFNGADPEWFLQEAEKRKKHIDHVYCELPFKEMISHVRFTFDDKKSAGDNPASIIFSLSDSVLVRRPLVVLYV